MIRTYSTENQFLSTFRVSSLQLDCFHGFLKKITLSVSEANDDGTMKVNLKAYYEKCFFWVGTPFYVCCSYEILVTSALCFFLIDDALQNSLSAISLSLLFILGWKSKRGNRSTPLFEMCDSLPSQTPHQSRKTQRHEPVEWRFSTASSAKSGNRLPSTGTTCRIKR